MQARRLVLCEGAGKGETGRALAGLWGRRRARSWLTGRVHLNAITLYGVCVLTFMMVMYMLERRHRRFIAAFALGCLLSSLYGFMANAWPFGVVEAVWAAVAVVRFRRSPSAPADPADPAATAS